MINIDLIQPNMPIVCSLGGQFAIVDHMEGSDTIKVKKDLFGQHHYIPLSWVISTANREVKINRTGNQAMREWSALHRFPMPMASGNDGGKRKGVFDLNSFSSPLINTWI